MSKKSLRRLAALLALAVALALSALGAGVAEEVIFPETEDAPAEEVIFPETEDAPADDAIFPETEDAPADDAIFPETEDAPADGAALPEGEDDGIFPENPAATGDEPRTGLEVYYFDLERVDGILIRCDGETCFIDVGYHRDAEKVLPYLKALGVEKLDCYIGTHAHADHIEGAPDIIAALRPDMVYVSHKPTWNAIVSYASKGQKSAVKNTAHKVLKPGDSFQLGGAEMRCLGPTYIRSCNIADTEENANSMICKLTYGARSFLFTGDTADGNLEAVEQKYPGALKSDVLKNPHHNGHHSDRVLDLVQPKATVFCTENDRLPGDEYLNQLKAHKSVYFITCSRCDGNVLITSDGEDLQAYCGYPLKTVKLNPVDSMVPGQKLRVTGSLEPARRANPERWLNWQSSNPEVVKVSRGTLTAVSEGRATITATAINGVCDSVEVVVANTGVVLNKRELQVLVGEAEQLRYKLTGEGRGTVEWFSDDTAIAMVTNEGEVIGTGVGQTRVVARVDGGAETACEVTVAENPVKYVELNKSKLKLKVGQTYQLEVKISPSHATDKRLEWASSDESVATVDAFGNVTAVGKGSAKIGVRAASGVYDLCRVKVE